MHEMRTHALFVDRCCGERSGVGGSKHLTSKFSKRGFPTLTVLKLLLLNKFMFPTITGRLPTHTSGDEQIS